MSDVITRVYGNFRGVDFRGDEINLMRSPDSLNVWKDYKETNSIRTRPGMKLLKKYEGTKDAGTVHGIYFFKGQRFDHVGVKLLTYQTANGTDVSVTFRMGDDSSGSGFVFEDTWYFKTQKGYWQTKGSSCEKVKPYVPTTSIARKPGGGGTIHEDINMLTGRRINTFLADGKSTEYFLDAKNIDEYSDLDDTDPDNGFDVVVKVDDKVVTNYTVDRAAGKIVFDTAPPAPKTDGQDNVSIEFKKTVPGNREAILNCSMIQLFDNRVFFSGNPDKPNMLWHCALDNPGYISDLDYYREGMDNAAVTGMVSGNNALWVFREPSDANTNVFYHTPTIDNEYGKIYPSTHSSVSIGCIGKATNFNDDIVFFSQNGMEGISGDVTTEQVAAHRSSLVDRKMITEKDYRKMILAEWEGYLMVFIGDKVYLADSRTAFSTEGHIEYDWFYWQMEKEITCATVYDGVLYLGTHDGVYTLTDYECDVESYWVTPKDKFKNPHKLKTTNKRGCVAEATGDISVYAKTEKTDFELIGNYENVTDYFVSRIKRKKFKDIQLKFHSKTRFSLETVTLECFIGAYIKR
jgi:hypothetical protein